MRHPLAALALVAALATGCSSVSSSDASSPPSHTATPTPTFTQLGTLAISQVLGARAAEADSPCPTVAEAFPDQYENNGYVACDARGRQALLLAQPVVNERQIEATTKARQPGGKWLVFLQLSQQGAQAILKLNGATYAVVYNGVVVGQSSSAAGGLIEIGDLSKVKAQRIARALNPS